MKSLAVAEKYLFIRKRNILIPSQYSKYNRKIPLKGLNEP